MSSEHISVPTTAAAELRVTVESSSADRRDRDQRHQVDGEADEHDQRESRGRR